MKRRYKGRRRKRRPGTLLYFGGAVHEVLDDGVTWRERKDLVPGSPKHLWRPKFAKGGTLREARTRWRRRARPLTASDKRQIRRWERAGLNPDTGEPSRRGRSGNRRSHRKDRPANRSAASRRRWVKGIHLKRGALHRQLGIPMRKKIPLGLLRRAARAPGVLGQRARLALTFRKMRLRKKSRELSALLRRKAS